MSKVLIMLTLTYPYDTGNNFLTNEYETINQKYDRVIVLCLGAAKHCELRHKLGSKWQVFKRTDIQNSVVRKIKYAVLGLCFLGKNDLKIELHKNKNILKKLVAIYYYGRLATFEKFIDVVKNKLQIRKEDKVVIYSFWFLQTAHCAIFLKKYLQNNVGCRTIAITRAHGYDLYEYRNKANYIPFRTRILQEIDKVFPCSKDGVNYLTEKYSEYSSKICCSYLGTVDHGINCVDLDDCFTIATCSSINYVKNLKLLAEALVILEQKECADIKWLCIGNGPLKDELQFFSKGHLKKIEVKFLGELPNEKVFELYKNKHIDAFINISLSEGLPVSIMEAQSQGIPVIATDVGGVSEIVNNKNGILLSKKPMPVEVAKAIRQIKNIKSQDNELMRKSSRKNWEKTFNAQTNYQIFHDLLLKQ